MNRPARGANIHWIPTNFLRGEIGESLCDIIQLSELTVTQLNDKRDLFFRMIGPITFPNSLW